jgi:hypothetical protein
MTRVFAVDIKIWATAYIRAVDEEEAIEKLQSLRNESLELPNTDWADEDEEIIGPRISGRQYDDPELPEVSLSPAVTIDGEHIDSVSPDELEERE